MKVKGIGRIEQHIEKLVLVLALTVLLAVVAMQFLLQPNLVKIGSGPEVPPEAAYHEAERLAEQKQKRMETRDPQGVEFQPPGLESEYMALLDSSSSMSLAIGLGKAVPVEGGAGEADLTGGSVAVVSVPMPTTPVAYTYGAAIHPGELQRTPELAALLPSEQPFDKTAVCLEFSFSGTALREALEADPDDAGPIRPMPGVWWRSRMAILGVEIEREQQTETGEWTNTTLVDRLPGRLDLLAELDKIQGQTNLGVLIDDAQNFATEIARPAYYSVIAGPDWEPATVATAVAEVSEEDEALQRELRQLEKLESEIERLTRAIDQQDRRSSDEEFNRPEDRGREGGGGREGERRQPAPREDPRIKRLETLEERRMDQLDLLWDQFEYDPDVIEEDRPAWQDQYDDVLLPLLENDSLSIWAYDVTAVPGTVYRYRARVVLNNPMYGRAAGLPKDQQSLAANAVIASPESEWSDPIEMDRQSYYFITSANTTDQLGGPKATAEVFRFYYGYWRRGGASLEPGDAIYTDVRVPEGLFIYDLEKMEELTQAPRQTRGPRGPRTDDREYPPDYNPDWERQREEEEWRRQEGRQPVGRQPRQTRQEEDELEIPEGAEPTPSELVVAVDAFLLDVSDAPDVSSGLGGARDRYFVYLRNELGAIEVRVPDEERSGTLYRRLTDSHQAGQEAVAPRDDEVAEDPVRPLRNPRRDRPDDRRSPSPGGPGGG